MSLGSAILGMLWLALFVCLTAQPAWADGGRVITMPIDQSEIHRVLTCAHNPSDSCRKCNDPGDSSVAIMNYTLVSEALRAGGINAIVRPIPSPNSERSRKMVSDGMADIKTDWSFNIAENKDVLQTEAIIRSGEFVKGLYGRRDHADFYADFRFDDLRELRAVSLRNWRLDWKVLEELSPASLISAATIQQVFLLIDIGRADFTLLEFSSAEGMVREIDGIKLFPISGVKASLPASQHFMVSRKMTDAKQVVESLDRGIRILHEEGFIRRCLINSGIIHPAVDGWRTLSLNGGNSPAQEPPAPSN